ncbi:MAG TPA: glycosyl hydrolase, partial [Pirellulales bacterium]
MYFWRHGAGFALIFLGLSCFTVNRASAQILDSKRGFADTNANYANLQATNATWYYDWGSSPPSAGINNFNADFYPMFWNAPSQNTINSVKATNPKYVLGFNEPEVSTQANLTVANAISSWNTIYSSFAGTGIKLVSPAVSDTSAGQAWLASFMATESSKVDAVAFHWYGDSTPNAGQAISDFEGSVTRYWNQYQKPVFITEFAIHDWGGNYTDAQIAEANREFLNAIVPWLDSNTHVAGYSFYHWFSDASLYTGNNTSQTAVLTPTPESYSYVGAIAQATTTDLGGQNIGEHVADLSGGTLTMTGSTAGTVKYIDALSGQSTITGSMDWAQSGTSNWIRIQSGATLIKSGTNQITFTGGAVTNAGTLQISQGTLRLASSVNGSGAVVVKGGTLALASSGSFNTSTSINVQPAGTFDVSAKSFFSLTSNQSLNVDGNAIGNVTASTGATVSGAGTFSNNLSAQSGSTIRVGADGAGVVSRIVIDNFENYALGHVVTVASPRWTANAGTTEADIVNVNGTKALGIGSTTTTFVGASLALPSATA